VKKEAAILSDLGRRDFGYSCFFFREPLKGLTPPQGDLRFSLKEQELKPS